jgi:hypothetical protein
MDGVLAINAMTDMPMVLPMVGTRGNRGKKRKAGGLEPSRIDVGAPVSSSVGREHTQLDWDHSVPIDNRKV